MKSLDGGAKPSKAPTAVQTEEAPAAPVVEEVIDFTGVEIEPRKMMGVESNGMLLSVVHNQNGEERLNLLMVGNKIPAGAKLY